MCALPLLAYLTALSHGAGLATFLQVSRGAGHVYPTQRSFQPEHFYHLVERHRVTAAIMVPTMIEALLNDPSHANYDMSSLRTIAYGASPMYVDRIKSAVQTFGPIFVQTYADRKRTRLNSSHSCASRMPSSA